MSIEVHIKSIPHEKQKYSTCGNYWTDRKGTLQVRVSETNDDYEFLIAVHELVEAYLTNRNGIKEEDITNFDIEFEKKRKKGNADEPGNDITAPYYKEHQVATDIEYLLADHMNIDWKKYETFIDNL